MRILSVHETVQRRMQDEMDDVVDAHREVLWDDRKK